MTTDPQRERRGERVTGTTLRMVPRNAGDDQAMIAGRFALGSAARWNEAHSDAWFDAIDTTTKRRAWILQRPMRALGSI